MPQQDSQVPLGPLKMFHSSDLLDTVLVDLTWLQNNIPAELNVGANLLVIE